MGHEKLLLLHSKKALLSVSITQGKVIINIICKDVITLVVPHKSNKANNWLKVFSIAFTDLVHESDTSAAAS